MFKAVAVLGLAASSAFVSAQGSNTTTTAAANNGSNPLIPTTISTGCQYALANINGDAVLAACTQPFLSLIQAVDPSSGGAVPSNVVSLLNSSCAQQEQLACSDSYVRGLLRSLSGNCSVELSTPNEVVLATYDALYMITPFREAVCSRDAKTGAFCVSELAAGIAPSSGGGSVTSSSSVANATGAAPTGGSVVSNTTDHAAQSSFDIADFAGAALEPANLVIQLTSANAATVLRKRGDVSLPSSAPSCADTCWTSKISEAGEYGLDPTSASSLCSNSDWTKSYTTCTSQNCDSSDVSAANAALSGICSAASSSTSSSNSTTSSSNATTSTSGPSQTAFVVNATTFASSYLPFLFISPKMTSQYVCGGCTQTVLLRYLQFEAALPYMEGLAASPLLGEQTTLWSGLSALCGNGFTSSIQSGTSAGDTSGAAPATRALSGVAAVAAAILSYVALL